MHVLQPGARLLLEAVCLVGMLGQAALIKAKFIKARGGVTGWKELAARTNSSE